MGAPTVREAIEQALADAREDYEAAGILVVTAFEATHATEAPVPALREALYTIFRGLPARLAFGASLFIGTFDRAGGDVELVWEARERPEVAKAGGGHARETLRAGPYGDLLELAILGLESLCGARSGLDERESADDSESTSQLPSRMRADVMRRYTFVFRGDRSNYPMSR